MPDLYDSLLERMEGHPYSNYFAAWCPFESHKTPALLVHDDGLFVCLSCDKKGTHAYLNKVIGSHYIPPKDNTVSKVLPQWMKWEQEYGNLDGIVNAAHDRLKRVSVYQTYLRRRKIYEYVEDGRLGYLDGWITFPVMDSRHQVVDIVVRSVSRFADTRYVVHPGYDRDFRCLYVPSWERVNHSETIYVVYGIIDAISMHLAGLPVVTGVTGKSLSYEILRPLRKRFIIVPDDGEEKAARQLENKLGWRAKIKRINYPDGTKDPDGIRRTLGNEYLLQSLSA
jgi:hypothetical protein